jgi:transposase
MEAYSQDLRDRVLRALERGERPVDIARRLEVSRIWVYQVKSRFKTSGERCSRLIGGHRVSRLAPAEQEVRAWIKKQPDLTLAELGERLRHEKGIQLKIPALWHQLNKWGLSFKKTLHASEQEREDVRLARDQWREKQKDQSRQQLVFLDETGVTTSMTRRYGRAPKGERCLDHAPHSHWHTNTFIAALRSDRVEAPWLLDGPMNGEAFLHYIQEVLGPTLQPGDIVVADNLSSHKVAGVHEAVTARGAQIIFLPPYSPDLNPIENFFAKLKALLRKAAERHFDALVDRIKMILQSVTIEECANYFIAAGYVKA